MSTATRHDTAWYPQAVIFWFCSLLTVSLWGVIETNSVLPAIFIALFPTTLGSAKRALFLIGATSVWILGPEALVVILPILLFAAIRGEVWLLALTAAILTPLLSSHLVNIPTIGHESLHPGSVLQLYLPLGLASLCFYKSLSSKAIWRLTSTWLLLVTLLFIVSGNWISAVEFTNPYWRLVLNLIPLFWLVVQNQTSDTNLWKPDALSLNKKPWVLVLVSCLSFLTLFSSEKPINGIIFDESHGPWESVKPILQPDSFGRGATYNYSALYKFSKEILNSVSIHESGILQDDLPTDRIFVLKMPTQKLSDTFQDSLGKWVSKGGRLLVIADHTNLYDTTTHINSFLMKHFHIKINETATFDPIGNPIRNTTGYFGKLYGSVYANNIETRWQTGASFKQTHLNLIPLELPNLSFSEDADYSKQNRFGPFLPRLSLPYLKHPTLAGFTYGSGQVQILLDSTPWSTFSLFEHQNRLSFQSILKTGEKPLSFKVASYIIPFLILCFLVVVATQSSLATSTCILLSGVLIGALFHIGLSSQHTIAASEKNLFVIAGKTARTELLPQLLKVGDQNFSRIISSTSKFDYHPTLIDDSRRLFRQDFSKNKNWLFLNPEVEQLPSPAELIKNLRSGINFTFIFDQSTVPRQELQTWLSDLGLGLKEWKALTRTEDPNPDLMAREEGSVSRLIGYVSTAAPTSLLSAVEQNWLFQSYRVRPNSSELAGRLNLSFAAREFSDSAIGDVWQGIRPSGIGRLRERQLASILRGEYQPSLIPDIYAKATHATSRKRASTILVFENGQLKWKAEHPETNKKSFDSAPSINIDAYFRDLETEAANFVLNHCQSKADYEECKTRLIASDQIEWVVSHRRQGGKTIAIELLHERTFSGLQSTWNIVFGYE